MNKSLIASLFLAIPLLAALFGWIMVRELNHDEQLFVSAGVLIGEETMYRDFLYGHLPNFPLLLNGIYQLTGTSHYLLVARLVIFLAWLFALACLYLLAIRWTGSRLLAVAAALILLGNDLLLDGPGIYATNSFIPVPFALLGMLLFSVASDATRKIEGSSALLLFLSGVAFSLAVGMKANYVFVALPTALILLFVPSAMPLRQRLLRRLLPFALGGILAGLPTLSAALSYPEPFFYSVFGSSTSSHIQYWQQQEPDNPTFALSGRLRYGYWLWTDGSNLLLLMGLMTSLLAIFLQPGARPWKIVLSDTRVVLAASLTALAVVVSLVPTPSFKQYFVPSLPFAILLLLALAGAAGEAVRGTLKAVLAGAAVLGLALNVNTYVAGLSALRTPDTWIGLQTHATARQIHERVCTGPSTYCEAKVATLAPIFVLEAGLKVYPELAAGPFVYRQADFLPSEQLAQLPAATIKTLPDLLERKPPAALLVGFEGQLDQPLAAYARSHGVDKHQVIYDGGPRDLYVMPRPKPRAEFHPL